MGYFDLFSVSFTCDCFNGDLLVRLNDALALFYFG